MKDTTRKKRDWQSYFNDWDYHKHARFCTVLYLCLYTFDMTVSYVLIKKLLGKNDK